MGEIPKLAQKSEEEREVETRMIDESAIVTAIAQTRGETAITAVAATTAIGRETEKGKGIDTEAETGSVKEIETETGIATMTDIGTAGESTVHDEDPRT